MNNKNLNTSVQFNLDLLSESAVTDKGLSSQNKNSFYNDYELYSLLNEINILLRNDLRENELIEKSFSLVSKYVDVHKYNVTIYSQNKIEFEKSNKFDLKIREYLFESGIVKLALDERKSLVIETPELEDHKADNNLLIIPAIYSKDLYALFIMEVNHHREEIFSKYFAKLEMIFGLIGSVLLMKFLNSEKSKLEHRVKELNEFIQTESNYATVGKICLKSFHNLKNRTQVIVSAFNILQKFSSNSENEKLNQIFNILDSEIPLFSKSIRMLSETAKNLVSENKPIYFEFDKFLKDIFDLSEILGLTKNLRINLRSNISKSKIFSNYHRLLEGFILLLLEIQSCGVREIDLQLNEDALRLNLIISFNSLNDDNNIRDLLDDTSNIKFVRIKSLFKMNSCSFLTKLSQNSFDIMISIPKRSSQFKLKESDYAKNFNS